VTAAKEQLNKHGAKLTANGTFDAATAAAVTKFQQEHSLTANGKVTTETWRELIAGVGAVGGYSLPIGKSVLPRSEYDDPHHDYAAIDLPVASGTSVYAVNGVTATKIGNTGGCGYGVTITAKDGGDYTYCHFRQAAVASGEVRAGQLIGYSGNTGRSSGPHLHLQIKRNGTLVCPQRLLLAVYDGKPVPSIGSLPTSGCSY
jgi:murein DD-endopeptidase MepM/ murein hydrolase activator NlpD